LVVGARLARGNRGHRFIVVSNPRLRLGIGKGANAWGIGFRLREDVCGNRWPGILVLGGTAFCGTKLGGTALDGMAAGFALAVCYLMLALSLHALHF
jgi:hypothetical protein